MAFGIKYLDGQPVGHVEGPQVGGRIAIGMGCVGKEKKVEDRSKWLRFLEQTGLHGMGKSVGGWVNKWMDG